MTKRRQRSSKGIHCTCVKVCFSEDGALLNAKIARALRRSQKRKEIRAYGDCQCGHWHLTSKEDKNGLSQVQQEVVDG
jgi:hypothetical protein